RRRTSRLRHRGQHRSGRRKEPVAGGLIMAAVASNDPVALRDCPLIVSTDIGGDPDDAIALALAAMTEPRLALVVTADEFPDGRRSILARHLLDLLGREDVVVAAGATAGE